MQGWEGDLLGSILVTWDKQRNQCLGIVFGHFDPGMPEAGLPLSFSVTGTAMSPSLLNLIPAGFLSSASKSPDHYKPVCERGRQEDNELFLNVHACWGFECMVSVSTTGLNLCSW